MQLKSPDDFAAYDNPRLSPRFQGENFTKNLELVERVKAIAEALPRGAAAGERYPASTMTTINR